MRYELALHRDRAAGAAGLLLPKRTARLILVAVLAGSAIMLTLSFTTETGRGIASIWAGLVLLFAVVVNVRRGCPPGRLPCRTSTALSAPI